MTDLLSYYTNHSPITDPGDYAFLYDDLPDDLQDLFAIIQGVLLHRLAASYYKVQLTAQQRKDIHLRTMAQRLGRLYELDPAPLTVSRTPAERQVGVCRDFAVFLTSILRHKGIPARMRVGFAEYLAPDRPVKIDHWITEYWDGGAERWVLVDADLGGIPDQLAHLPANPLDLVPNQDFYLAGEAWQRARAGLVSSSLFRFNGRWKGFPCIRGNLLHDFQALNRLELGVFDYFDDLSTRAEHKLTVEDKKLLDQIAALTVDVNANFDELQNLFETLPRTHQVVSKLQLLGVLDTTTVIQPDQLRRSNAAVLAALSSNGSGETTQPNLSAMRLEAMEQADDLDGIGFPVTAALQPPPGMGDIIIRGARQHNLKNIDVVIPRHKLVVVTGVSGSGKSSLAFDTIYAEGQRRYVESLSSYARQFMGQMEKPQVDQITGLSPAIAIEQKTISRNPRSTVGTVTEILDYLRVLYARVGTPHCPQCGRAVEPQSAQQISDQLAALQPGTRFQILSPVIRGRKGTHHRLLRQALKDGYTRARVNGEVVDLTQKIPSLDKNKKHQIELIIDRLVIPTDPGQNGFRSRLMDSVETALRAADGAVVIVLPEDEIILSEHHACPVCEISFPELQPNLFSFNSPFGMCETCNGLGVQLQVDPSLIITKPHLSLLDGASPWYGNVRKKGRWTSRSLASMADHYQADLELPWKDLPESFQNVILYGSGGEKIHFTYDSGDGAWKGESFRDAKGAVFQINRLFRQTKSEGTRRYYMSFMSKQPCPKCSGERLCPEARFVTVGGKRLPELTSWSIEAIHDWVSGLPGQLNTEQHEIGGELITEIQQRLGFIRNVGLHYLTLDRPAPTLSGGEGQRIRLASQIGSGLVGVLYILDEPSIGLHTRDHRALLDTLTHLRDTGNTVLVVEHDADTMLTADWIIDLGPGPGVMGGELVAAGSPEEIMANPDSLTGRYLSGDQLVTPPNGRTRRAPIGWLTLRRARLHNLREVDAHFPLGTLVCVTGVSGSGKSSLIAQTLHPALARSLHNAQTPPGPHDAIDGLDAVDKVINITQDPIGRNPRSNPGTYAGVLPEVRKVFANMPAAKAAGYKAGRFSFNMKGGRCETCAGYGYKKVEMHFLADVWVKCQTCGGRRFNRETLAITYKGKNIADVMDMDVQEALAFFGSHPAITRILQTLHDVGLDYIKLGQSALTLSGGEAQRVKLAKELSRVGTGRTIYILDEPTTGLHFADIQRLLDVLHQLVDAGNTVIVIEHNMDVIKSADWIIDLGPEGGAKGGQIVAAGTPEDVTQDSNSHTARFLRDILSGPRRTRQLSTSQPPQVPSETQI